MAGKKIDDALTDLETAAAGVKQRVEADETLDQQEITDLKAEVARLQAIIDEGGTLTDAQQQRLDAALATLSGVEGVVPQTP